MFHVCCYLCVVYGACVDVWVLCCGVVGVWGVVIFVMHVIEDVLLWVVCMFHHVDVVC